MARQYTARTRRRRRRIHLRRAGALLLLIAALAVVRDYRSSASSSATALPLTTIGSPRTAAPRGDDDPLGEAGGAVPAGTTIFDDDVPGVAKLDGDLLGAVRRASDDAGRAFVVESGWRSEAYQRQLRREAVSRYGSEEEAARWVAAPDRSAHVSGDAIDVGPAAAYTWLSAHGAAYGLCQIYGNEPWHYELRPDAAEQGCPPMYADPTHDPRLQP